MQSERLSASAEPGVHMQDKLAFNKRIGERIRQIRKDSGLSQGELAELIDVEQKHVSRWELGGRVPDVYTLVGLSEALGIPLSELVEELNPGVDLGLPEVLELKPPPSPCYCSDSEVRGFLSVYYTYPTGVQRAALRAAFLILDLAAMLLGR